METHWLLLVETDILVRHLLAEYLRDCGYKVAEAANANEARRLLADANLPIDLVLADAAGDLDGSLALARWLRAEHPEIQVILGGTAEKMAAEAGSICDDGPALTKPYDHKLVLARIKQFLAAKARASQKA